MTTTDTAPERRPIPTGEAVELHGWHAERAWAEAQGLAALPYVLWEQAMAQCAVLWTGFARRALQ